MTKAAIYTRISSDRGGEALGTARQEKDCRALAKAKGWQVIEVYTDNDVSATSAKPRPGYLRMIEEVKAKRIDAIVTWDLDRLTRKPRELEDVIDLADEYGIALASVGGEIDLGTVQGRAMARMKGTFARMEAESMSRRLKAKHAEIAASGGWHGGGHRPYGFEKDRMTPRPAEVAIIREAATRVLNGESLRSVCLDLTRRGVPSASGGSWNPTSLRLILTNPRTAGLRSHNGVSVPAVWPALLDLDTIEALRDALDPKKRTTSGTSALRHHWASVLRCEACSGPMSVKVSGGKPRYTCRQAADAVECRAGVSITKQNVDVILDEMLLRRVESEGDLGEAQADDGTAEVEVAIERAEKRLDALAEAFADDGDPEAFRAASKAVTTRLEALREDLRQRRSSQRVRVRLDPAAVRAAWPTMTPQERREVVNIYVERVTVARASSRGSNRFDPNRLTVSWA